MDSVAIKNIFWQKSQKIPLTNWSICGYSRSAFRTGFYIPELRLMLDAGPQNHNFPSHILITHTHIDHVAGLPLTLLSEGKRANDARKKAEKTNSPDTNKSDVSKFCGQNDQEKPVVFGPREAEQYVVEYIRALNNVNSMRDRTKDSGYQAGYIYSGLSGGDLFRICANKTHLLVQVFACDHSVPTVSYGLSIIKDKLKPEYLGLSGKEIVELKKTGVEITHEVIEKKLAYICDTSIAVLSQTDILLYPVVMIECTFLLDDEIENAIETKHIHWKHLLPFVLSHPEIIFILFHFSQRYCDAEINAFFMVNFPHLKNIQIWA